MKGDKEDKEDKEEKEAKEEKEGGTEVVAQEEEGEPKYLLFSSKEWGKFERATLGELGLKKWTIGLLANVVYHVSNSIHHGHPMTQGMCAM